MRRTLIAAGAALPLLCPAFALAQTPHVINGRLIPQAAASGLATAAAWFVCSEVRVR